MTIRPRRDLVGDAARRATQATYRASPKGRAAQARAQAKAKGKRTADKRLHGDGIL